MTNSLSVSSSEEIVSLMASHAARGKGTVMGGAINHSFNKCTLFVKRIFSYRLDL